MKLFKKNLLVNDKITIKNALSLITKSGKKCLVIVDKKLSLLGTLSDGDLRNDILKHNNLNKSIKTIYNKYPFYVKDINIKEAKLKKIFITKKYALIPIINKQKYSLSLIEEALIAKSEKDLLQIIKDSDAPPPFLEMAQIIYERRFSKVPNVE